MYRNIWKLARHPPFNRLAIFTLSWTISVSIEIQSLSQVPSGSRSGFFWRRISSEIESMNRSVRCRTRRRDGMGRGKMKIFRLGISRSDCSRSWSIFPLLTSRRWLIPPSRFPLNSEKNNIFMARFQSRIIWNTYPPSISTVATATLSKV